MFFEGICVCDKAVKLWRKAVFPFGQSSDLVVFWFFLHFQDGHVEVARLLLDSGAQVNMPADSFESPLTLAACGGHVELAALLIERGANLEEVNDEGYTPLMEAAREGHEEMVALLLGQGNCCGALCGLQLGEEALSCCGFCFLW